MRWFDYFATFEESIAILQEICTSGLKVIAQPDMFDQPLAPMYDHVDGDLAAMLKQAPSFFLSGQFTRFPICFTQIKSGAAEGKFSIDFLTQGPVLQFLLARNNLVEGSMRLLPGRISFQATYRNPKTNEWEKAAKDVQTAFQETVSTIKSRCVIHNVGTDIFIAPKALALLENHDAIIKASHIMKSK
jgi:hypothetical protein